MKFISSTGGAENFFCQRFDRLCSRHVLSIFVILASSVARGGGRGGATAPPIGLPTKMQNKKNTTFLALLRLPFALD